MLHLIAKFLSFEKRPRKLREKVSLGRHDESLFERKPFELSGGRETCGLASAASHGAVLVFDGPTAGLDPFWAEKELI